jgi:aspartyl protease family protein
MSRDLPGAGDLPSRLGKVMLFAAWAVGLTILALFFQRMLDDQQNPNRDIEVALDAQGRAQVVLQRNRAGHYVASGRINGESVTFLIDTGATDVALPLGLATRLDLPLGRSRIAKTANGNVQTWSTRLDSVEIGGLRARRVQASVLPNMPGGEVLLGMSYLKNFELIQRGTTLTLRPPGRVHRDARIP